MLLFRHSVILALCAAASAPALLNAQSSTLLVLSKHDHTLALVDPTTLKVTARVPVGNDPHEVIASTDGQRAYVSNYGFGAFHTLAVVDLAAAKPLPEVDLGALTGPHGLVYLDDHVFFTAEGAKALGAYDTTTGKVDFILGTGQNRTHMIYVAPGAQRIVTTNVSSATVSIWSKEALPAPGPPPGMQPPVGMPPPGKRTDWNQTLVPVGRGSEGFDVSPDGQQIWTANAQDGTLSVIDFAQRKVVDTLAIDVPGANRLKITPDGTQVLVSAGNTLVVLDRASRKVTKRIAIGSGSAGLLIEPDGARAFIACGRDNAVKVVDLKSMTVIGTIDAGGEPDGLAWASHP